MHEDRFKMVESAEMQSLNVSTLNVDQKVVWFIVLVSSHPVTRRILSYLDMPAPCFVATRNDFLANP